MCFLLEIPLRGLPFQMGSFDKQYVCCFWVFCICSNKFIRKETPLKAGNISQSCSLRLKKYRRVPTPLNPKPYTLNPKPSEYRRGPRLPRWPGSCARMPPICTNIIILMISIIIMLSLSLPIYQYIYIYIL